MRKNLGFSIVELILVICVTIIVVHFTFSVAGSIDKKGKKEILVQSIYTAMNKIIKEQHETKPVDTWEWEGENIYEISNNILNKNILPYVSKSMLCTNPLNCVGGFMSMDGEEYVNYRQKTDYARAIVGKEHMHFALRANGKCKRGESSSMCALLIVDLDNKNGNNRLGDDVFMFGLYGDGSFMPYGHNFSYDKIDSGCNKKGYGDTCAAKIMYDDWKITYDNFEQ